MTTFATEFPVRSGFYLSAFVAQVSAWLKGTNYSTVFDDAAQAELDKEASNLLSASGEALRLRSLVLDSEELAIGFRHDYPDDDGRLWRTEAVLRRKAALDGQDVIRLRTQCTARRAGVRLENPRKPYLIKSLLADNLGGVDGEFVVSDAPVWLSNDSNESLNLATSLVNGSASRYLPIIYVSAVGISQWVFSNNKIKKLAYELGGIAHVVIEPDRTFSFRLRDETVGRNTYGGAIGISIPGRGIVRRLFLGGRLTNARELQLAVCEAAHAFRSNMPAEGWDWTELQEQALRQQRERDRNRLNLEETQGLYEEEIDNLKDQIADLKNRIAQNNATSIHDSKENSMINSLSIQIGPEIYSGEFFDRLRLAAKNACQHAERDGLDSRSKVVLEGFLALPTSLGLSNLIGGIERATKDSGRLAADLTTLLTRHGYQKKAQNKHVRLEPKAGFGGLGTLTIPTTPSDKRGLANIRKQIVRTLGVGKLLDINSED